MMKSPNPLTPVDGLNPLCIHWQSKSVGSTLEDFGKRKNIKQSIFSEHDDTNQIAVYTIFVYDDV